jgi:glycosyltransferase involved in cell wall biosynthesis
MPPRYVVQALDSIETQTLPPAEVIVVDDGRRIGLPDAAQGHASRLRSHSSVDFTYSGGYVFRADEVAPNRKGCRSGGGHIRVSEW